MTRTIVAATDCSAEARLADRLAARIANETGSELVLTHVWQIPPLVYAQEAQLPSAYIEKLGDDAQSCLDEEVRVLRATGRAPVSGRLLVGAPWSEIVDTASELHAWLVVVGSRGVTGIQRILLGSVAEKVLRHAPCSVLIVRGGEPRPFASVLCPVDFSDHAETAVELATRLVRPGGTGITLLHCVEAPVAYRGEALGQEFLRSLDRAATRELDELAARTRRTAPVEVSVRTRLGSASHQILALLDEQRYDLVVMGSHGRTGLRRALVGSVAEKVARHAGCPVLVTRPEPETA